MPSANFYVAATAPVDPIPVRSNGTTAQSTTIVRVSVGGPRNSCVTTNNSVMSLEEARRTQRPYRYGMILLCLGALVNWLGLAENYSEPVRYAGVACILMGGLLICTAMCCWLHTPNRSSVSDLSQNNPNDDQNVHIITINERTRCEKPPDYEAVTMEPPSYDDAIKLNPSALLPLTSKPPLESNNNTVFLISSVASQLQGVPRPSSSLSNQPNNDGAAIIDIENTVTVVDEKKTSSPNEIPR